MRGLLLLTATVSWISKKDRLFRWMTVIAGFWFLIISTPLFPVLLINSLEDQYQPLYVRQLTDKYADYHIIVFGGGYGFDDRFMANALLSQNALGRLSEGIRLHRQLPNSKLVLSGSTSTPGRTTQAEMLQRTVLLLGIEEENTLMQKEPMNTYQEAKIYSENYSNSHPVILVISATHMPRKVMTFNMYGIEPIASPTNYL